MATIVELGFKANTSDLTKADKELNKLTKSGASVDKTNNSLSGSFKALAASVGLVVASYQSLSKIVDISRQFDVLNAQLITATGSAENAAIAFGAIQQFAATTPYDLAQATKAFTQLVNFGLTPSQAALTSYGNTASAMGKDLSQMVEAVADATTGEFERLKEFGIKSKTEGENISFTFRGVTETVGKNAAEIEGYLLALGNNEFAGAMAERAATLDGAISNLGDTWDNLFLTISGMGVGDLMKESVITASTAIEALDSYIASGALTNSFNAVLGRFDGFVGDISNGFHVIRAIVDESSREWSDDVSTFFDNMYQGLKQLPEMTRFYIQLAAVNIGKFVDYAAIYGSAFVDMMKLKFNEIVGEAVIAGQKVGNAMNPFSDEFDYSAARSSFASQIREQESEITESVMRQIAIIDKVSEEVINGYALQTAASIEKTEKQLSESDKLLAAFLAEKEAVDDTIDTLAQFKIDDTATKQIQAMQKEAEELKDKLTGADMFNSIADSAKVGLSSIQDLSAQGSNEYAKLGVAIQAVTALQAVQAVVNQAAGTNPYESFAKMAAMVSALGALGVSVGSIGGTLSDDSASVQASQGLDVWGDKSESISNSIDMTADATDQLVGINTNMLSALVSLSDNIASAVGVAIQDEGMDDLTSSISVDTQLFSGVTSILTEGLTGALSFISGGFVTGWLFDKVGSLLGGSSTTSDQGIQIAGGTLEELAAAADVDAYLTTKYKKYAWSSTKKRTDYADLDEASLQFSLVFDSLADAVFEGASALGMGTQEITDAINTFEIETQKISLKGLSAEEQQEEIENVFSTIFDNLAVSVVPYIANFVEVGEGYGETLARLATQVQIADILVSDLGITMGDKLADPEMYLTIADNLSTMAGGIDDFADKTASFIDSFAPDSVKLGIYTAAMTDALSAVGLTLPDTTEGFWDLMSGIDATTEAGQEQIAALLNLTDTADEYYSLLDDTLGDFNDTLQSLSTSILSVIDDMFGVTYETALTSLDDALMLARAGSFDAALGLDLTSLQASESDFSSLAEYNIAQAKTGNKLAELAEITGEEKTTADLALAESINQTSLLAELKAKVLETNELLVMQNRLQAESLENLDIINNKTEYAS